MAIKEINLIEPILIIAQASSHLPSDDNLALMQLQRLSIANAVHKAEQAGLTRVLSSQEEHYEYPLSTLSADVPRLEIEGIPLRRTGQEVRLKVKNDGTADLNLSIINEGNKTQEFKGVLANRGVIFPYQSILVGLDHTYYAYVNTVLRHEESKSGEIINDLSPLNSAIK